MTLILKLEALAGDSIETTAREMCEVAKRMGLRVEVRFNGVLLSCTSSSKPHQIVKNFKQVVGDTHIKHKTVIV